MASFKITAVLFLLAIPLIGYSQDFENFFERKTEFKGTVYSRLNFDFIRDNYMEDFLEWRNKLFMEVKVPVRKSSTIVFSGKVFYNLFWNEKEEESNTVFDIYEAYISFPLGSFELSLGKQFLLWGKTDVSPLNVFVPLDYREFLFMEEEFINKPVLMARAGLYHNDWYFEGVFVPFYEPPEFSIIGEDWSLFIPELMTQTADSYETIKAVEKQITPVYFDYPDKDLRNSEFGFRVNKSAGTFDLGGMIYYGWTRFPALYFHKDFLETFKRTPGSTEERLWTISPTEIISYSTPDGDESTEDHFIKAKPIRSFTTGFSFSTTFKGYGLLGDIGFTYPVPFYSDDLYVVKEPLLTFAMNVDHIFPYDVYLNLFFTEYFLPDYDVPLFIVKRFNTITGLFLRKSFFNERFTFEIRGVIDLNYADWMIDFRFTYSFNDNFKFIAGTHILDGRRASPFGYFRENDEWMIGIKYSF